MVELAIWPMACGLLASLVYEVTVCCMTNRQCPLQSEIPRHSAGEPYDVDQPVVKYNCSCVDCGF